MKRLLHLPPFLLVVFLSRLLLKGTSIAEAIVFIALSALYAGYLYLENRKEEPLDKQNKDRLVELEESHKLLKDKVNSLVLGSSLRK